MRRVPLRAGATAVLLAYVALLGAIFLYLVGIDALEGRNEFQFFADSETYHAASRGEIVGVDGAGDLVRIASNYLGPMVILLLTDGNYYAVLLVNIFLMFISIRSISKTVGLDSLKYSLLLLLNPMTISSILSVNKEILLFPFLATLLRAVASRSTALFLLAGALSVLVRWQAALVVIVLVPMISMIRPVGHRRFGAIAAVLLVLSIVYVQLAPVFESVQAILDASDWEGSGFFDALVGLQNKGLYFAIFPVKAAHMMFALGLRMDRLLAPANLYNDVWQLLSSTATLLMFIALWSRRRIRLNNDLVFIAAIYIVVFALSPIYAPRYFYPVYMLWAAALLARSPLVRLRSPGKAAALVVQAPQEQAHGDHRVAQ